ncbi:MAG TPA: hypothetical protein VKU82_09105, partial [Planctomycetaceae bacterium]|nr:hypothetical protein [Planctomycetaceae bacterium]
MHRLIEQAFGGALQRQIERKNKVFPEARLANRLGPQQLAAPIENEPSQAAQAAQVPFVKALEPGSAGWIAGLIIQRV